jgi:hypothetical protein
MIQQVMPRDLGRQPGKLGGGFGVGQGFGRRLNGQGQTKPWN